jgi:hypothetical protein
VDTISDTTPDADAHGDAQPNAEADGDSHSHRIWCAAPVPIPYAEPFGYGHSRTDGHHGPLGHADGYRHRISHGDPDGNAYTIRNPNPGTGDDHANCFKRDP